jgi:hypothetical protein
VKTLVDQNGSLMFFFRFSHNENWDHVFFIISLFKNTFVRYETSDERFIHLESTDAVVIQEMKIKGVHDDESAFACKNRFL